MLKVTCMRGLIACCDGWPACLVTGCCLAFKAEPHAKYSTHNSHNHKSLDSIRQGANDLRSRLGDGTGETRQYDAFHALHVGQCKHNSATGKGLACSFRFNGVGLEGLVLGCASETPAKTCRCKPGQTYIGYLMSEEKTWSYRIARFCCFHSAGDVFLAPLPNYAREQSYNASLQPLPNDCCSSCGLIEPLAFRGFCICLHQSLSTGPS